MSAAMVMLPASKALTGCAASFKYDTVDDSKAYSQKRV
jgi:hypothetical protein